MILLNHQIKVNIQFYDIPTIIYTYETSKLYTVLRKHAIRREFIIEKQHSLEVCHYLLILTIGFGY